MSKSETLAARCSPLEAKIVTEIARVETNGSHSAALRMLVREGGKRRGLWDALTQQEYERREAACEQAA